MNAAQWAAATDPETMKRRAIGRAAYNKRRAWQAFLRRLQVRRILYVQGRALEPGIRAKIARQLGVDRSVICRDIQRIKAERGAQVCPRCGAMHTETLVADPFDESANIDLR
jgi:hypothetical protein